VSANFADDSMPIQHPPYHRSTLRVPFAMLDPVRTERNHQQTRERLRQRGGLGPMEALWIIDDVRYGSKEYGDPMRELSERVAAWIGRDDNGDAGAGPGEAVRDG
jgi:hypothetical protein